MHKRTIGRGLLSAAVLAASVAVSAGPALALVNATTQEGQANSDKLRAGGSSAGFKISLVAMLNQFSNITRVFRLCGSGGGISNSDQCDTSFGKNPGVGKLQDFVVVQGTLRNSTTDSRGLGVPNGPALGEVTYRLSANGSGKGPLCAGQQVAFPANPATNGIGFLVPEGFDGLPATADDAGGTGGFGGIGDGAGGTGSGMTSAPLVKCNTKLATSLMPAVTGSPATVFSAQGTNNELCVVNFDFNSAGTIAGSTQGAALPGAITSVVQGAADGADANETTNLKLTCDMGFTDVPPADFDDPAVNTGVFNKQTAFGDIIFKLIASKDVHGPGGATDKIALFEPQVQNLLATGSSSICSWDAIGASAGSTNTNVGVCGRKLGSGTRATTFKTHQITTQGQKAFGNDATGGAPGTTVSCLQKNAANAGVARTKTFFLWNGTSDVDNCAGSKTGAVGYLDGDVSQAGKNWYEVPYEGVDPQTNVLKTMVKCGMYRYYGAFTGGDGARCLSSAPPTGNCDANPFVQANRKALSVEANYSSGTGVNLAAYLPLGGCSGSGASGLCDGPVIQKTSNLTDGTFDLKFLGGAACPAKPALPAAIP